MNFYPLLILRKFFLKKKNKFTKGENREITQQLRDKTSNATFRRDSFPLCKPPIFSFSSVPTVFGNQQTEYVNIIKQMLMARY